MSRIILTDAPDARPASPLDTINAITAKVMLPGIQQYFDTSRRWTMELKIANLRKSCGVEDRRGWTGSTITENYSFKVPTR